MYAATKTPYVYGTRRMDVISVCSKTLRQVLRMDEVELRRRLYFKGATSEFLGSRNKEELQEILLRSERVWGINIADPSDDDIPRKGGPVDDADVSDSEESESGNF